MRLLVLILCTHCADLIEVQQEEILDQVRITSVVILSLFYNTSVLINSDSVVKLQESKGINLQGPTGLYLFRGLFITQMIYLLHKRLTFSYKRVKIITCSFSQFLSKSVGGVWCINIFIDFSVFLYKFFTLYENVCFECL